MVSAVSTLRESPPVVLRRMPKPALRSLCSGYGGLDHAVEAVFGVELHDWSDIAPEIMEFREPDAKNLGDLKLIDWSSLDYTDILTAGYPCQPFSNAGLRLGTTDPRHLWPYLAEGIGVLRPRIVVLENVAAHLRRGFDVVLADLAELGYRTAWTVNRASDIGAPHQRRRLFIVATTDTAGDGRDERRPESAGFIGRSDLAEYSCWAQFAPAIHQWESVLGRPAPDPTQLGTRGGQVLSPRFVEWMMGLPDGWVTDVPGLTRNAQLKFLGNGVVPQQAESAIRYLLGQLAA